MKQRRVWTLAAAGALILLCAHSIVRAQKEAPPLGFSAASGEAELSAERKLEATISVTSMRKFHEWLTEKPHVAGTAPSNEQARKIAEALRGFGMKVELHQYRAYLSYPNSVQARILSPKPVPIPTSELPAEGTRSDLHPQLKPAYVAYSASGKVRGPVIYVNYGLPADYEALAKLDVDVREAIVLARYGNVHRAVKVYTAEQRGAKGIILYSDPADDGEGKGPTWPAGPWRGWNMLQRGNAKYSWFWHGDPLTPNVAAKRDAPRLRPQEAPTLPKIPAIVVPVAAGLMMQERLSGAIAPANFQGIPARQYRTGAKDPSKALSVELDVEMAAGLRTITDVVARIEGSEEPDRWVMLGGHHDAWKFGGVDPGSAGAVLLELARSMGELRKSGWQPRRSILFCFWDAEEYGLIGSTEYAEEFADELREKAVAYINSDMYLAGRLRAGGAASLRNLMVEVARAVESPKGSHSLHEEWLEVERKKRTAAELERKGKAFEVELDPLGSGADFVPFQTHLGIPSLSLEFGDLANYGTYHSSYDTREYMEKFGDPGWKYGPVLAELLGRTAMRLASADVLPLRFTHTAEKLQDYVRRLEESNVDTAGNPRIQNLGFGPLHDRLNKFRAEAIALDRALGAADEKATAKETRRKLNDHLLRAEKSFVVRDENQNAPARWYRHTVYGWNIYALYAGQTLPALHRALEAGDAKAFAAERARLERAIESANEEIKRGNEEVKLLPREK